MKVVIEIHDGEVTAAVPQAGVAAAATKGVTPPPAELLAAAAAVGATNAGPAPAGMMAPVAPMPAITEQALIGEDADVAAGAAPGTPSD